MNDTEAILQEVKDHAAYWNSNMAKRLTVEKHLTEKGVQDVTAKVDALINSGKLVLTHISKHSAEYLQVKEES